MRISTNMMYELGTRKISDLQSNVVRTQQQLSTQRRVLTPADDPVASASIIGLSQSMSVNDQFATNRQNAKNYLQQEESILQSVTTLLQDAKTLVVNAGNGTLEDTQRKFIAAELRGRFQELLGLANSRDGAGNFMFGGFQIASQPFSETATGATYYGDQGQRMLQIGASRQIGINDSGSSIFEKIKTGNGTFVTAPGAANVGSGIVSTGAAIDPTTFTNQPYTIQFTVQPPLVPFDPEVVTFTIQNNTTNNYYNPTTIPPSWAAGPPVAANQIPYVAGQAISFDGIQFDIKGKPANNDTFTVQPSTNQNIFETFTKLLATLEGNGMGAAGQAKLTNGLSQANNNIDNALGNVLSARASVGTRLKEIDVLDSTGSDLNVQYTEALRGLQEIDLAEAISSFTQQQITLEAAQKSFLQISRLSLFNYI